MERDQISLQQAKLYIHLKGHSQWATAREIAKGSRVASRTVRQHLLNLVKFGIVEKANVFPNRYRLSPQAEKIKRAYVQRLEEAQEILGL